jgi:hypothetical protein
MKKREWLIVQTTDDDGYRPDYLDDTNYNPSDLEDQNRPSVPSYIDDGYDNPTYFDDYFKPTTTDDEVQLHHASITDVNITMTCVCAWWRLLKIHFKAVDLESFFFSLDYYATRILTIGLFMRYSAPATYMRVVLQWDSWDHFWKL